MTDTWNQWKGRTIGGQFVLGDYLGGSHHSAVYATEIAGPERRRVAIKFLAESPQEDKQLDRWAVAAGLSHPNLLQVLQSGTCRVDAQEFLYVVMEFAEEDLSQILPQRALSPGETRGMVQPVLEAVAHLHGKGLVHTRIKPSNILAVGDQIKLTCDQICPANGPMIRWDAGNAYEAPEAAAEIAIPPSDVWSLGVTLVEALTQHPPSWRESSAGELEVAETLPAPFQSIATNALAHDPAKRWNVTDIQCELDPGRRAAAPVATMTAQQPPPQVVEPARVPTPPARKAAVPVALAAQHVTPRGFPRPESRTRRSPLWFVIPGMAIAASIVAWIALSRSTQSPAVNSKTPPVAQASSAPLKTERPSAEETNRRAERPLSKPPKKSDATEVPPVTPASLSSAVPKTETSGGSKGQVLDQVLPEASQKARDTIRGTVRVGIRVHVEPSGSVASAEFDSAGPSQYFADLALKAVKRWEFIAPEVDGRSVASEWLVRIEFTQSGAKAFPKQMTP